MTLRGCRRGNLLEPGPHLPESSCPTLSQLRGAEDRSGAVAPFRRGVVGAGWRMEGRRRDILTPSRAMRVAEQLSRRGAFLRVSASFWGQGDNGHTARSALSPDRGRLPDAAPILERFRSCRIGRLHHEPTDGQIRKGWVTKFRRDRRISWRFRSNQDYIWLASSRPAGSPGGAATSAPIEVKFLRAIGSPSRLRLTPFSRWRDSDTGRSRIPGAYTKRRGVILSPVVWSCALDRSGRSVALGPTAHPRRGHHARRCLSCASSDTAG